MILLGCETVHLCLVSLVTFVGLEFNMILLNIKTGNVWLEDVLLVLVLLVLVIGALFNAYVQVVIIPASNREIPAKKSASNRRFKTLKFPGPHEIAVPLNTCLKEKNMCFRITLEELEYVFGSSPMGK